MIEKETKRIPYGIAADTAACFEDLKTGCFTYGPAEDLTCCQFLSSYSRVSVMGTDTRLLITIIVR
jgi:hypothetical protein